MSTPITSAAAHRAPTAPRHLSASSRVIWRGILAEFDLESHHLLILTAALEARDRLYEARAAIERDGAYVDGRYGAVAHPAIKVENDCRIALMRGLRELGLDLETPATSRPPSRWRQGVA